MEAAAMRSLAMIFCSERRFGAAQRIARMAQAPLTNKEGWIRSLPGVLGGWTQARDLQEMPKETFREWWKKRGQS